MGVLGFFLVEWSTSRAIQQGYARIWQQVTPMFLNCYISSNLETLVFIFFRYSSQSLNRPSLQHVNMTGLAFKSCAFKFCDITLSSIRPHVNWSKKSRHKNLNARDLKVLRHRTPNWKEMYLTASSRQCLRFELFSYCFRRTVTVREKTWCLWFDWFRLQHWRNKWRWLSTQKCKLSANCDSCDIECRDGTDT